VFYHERTQGTQRFSAWIKALRFSDEAEDFLDKFLYPGITGNIANKESNKYE
jgi:hypothetical protein